jgi:peptidoglycan hydrolase-like protein with peptidoglycan-binding domain
MRRSDALERYVPEAGVLLGAFVQPRYKQEDCRTSEVVRELQRDFDGLGFPVGTMDGLNGPATRTAVARFQFAYGWRSITLTGMYGPQTMGHCRRPSDRPHVTKLYAAGMPVEGRRDGVGAS